MRGVPFLFLILSTSRSMQERTGGRVGSRGSFSAPCPQGCAWDGFFVPIAPLISAPRSPNSCQAPWLERQQDRICVKVMGVWAWRGSGRRRNLSSTPAFLSHHPILLTTPTTHASPLLQLTHLHSYIAPTSSSHAPGLLLTLSQPSAIRHPCFLLFLMLLHPLYASAPSMRVSPVSVSFRRSSFLSTQLCS